jgi:hypothetical protein
MNRTQKKKWLTAIGICAALILCGIGIAVVSLKFGFPAPWAKSGFLVSFVGAGGIGVVIAFYVHSIPNQNKYRENRLQAKAWKDLGMYFYCLVVGAISFHFLTKTNERNLLIVVLAIVLGVWVAVGQFVQKKRILRGLDERERLIHEKAKMISDAIFGGLCLAGFIGMFGWFGPKTPIPVFVPVLMFFTLAFVAEIVKPLMILIQCKMEQVDE